MPDGAVLLPSAEDVGLDLVAGAEAHEGGVGDDQLLVRGGRQREGPVVGEQGLSGLQVEGDRGRPGLGDVRHREGLRESLRQWRASRARRTGQKQREDDDDRQAAAGHLAIVRGMNTVVKRRPHPRPR